jgi:sugar-specific transcriptional regulator TrmB
LLNGEILKILEDLGLSCSGARVYSTLLKLGPDCKATSISKYSKVPRQDIYRVLEELEQNGMVEKLISRPAKFRAVPAKKAISLLLKKKKEAFSKLEKDADSLSARIFEDLGNAPMDSKKDRFILITEREAIICKSQEVIRASRKEVKLIIPWSEIMLAQDLALEGLNEACNRGVEVKWLSDEPQEAQQLPEGLQKLAKNPKFRIRLNSDPPTVKLGIYDDEEICLALYPDSSSALSPALCSNNPAIVAIAKKYFDTYWNSGKDIVR